MKDTGRFRSSGARLSITITPNEIVLKGKPVVGNSLSELFYLYKTVDFVFVEGFKDFCGPRIGVCSFDPKDELLPPGDYLAIVGDFLPPGYADTVFFNREQIREIADFIENYFLNSYRF